MATSPELRLLGASQGDVSRRAEKIPKMNKNSANSLSLSRLAPKIEPTFFVHFLGYASHTIKSWKRLAHRFQEILRSGHSHGSGQFRLARHR